MFLKLVLAFTLIPIVELYLLIEVGAIIGGFETILIILITGVCGAGLARSQGLRILSEINMLTSQGKLPHRELVEGVLVLIGGFTLLTPGFVTDILGLLMIIPLTRKLTARFVETYFRKKIREGQFKAEVDIIDVTPK